MPRSSDTGATPIAGASTAHTGITRRAPLVLLAEDDETMACSLQAVLEDAGFHVETAVNGRDALDMLNRSPVDAIVLDLIMPIMDGWEFVTLQKSNARLAHIPVVVTSGDVSAKASAIRADRQIRKPFATGQLVEILNELLCERQRQVLLERIEEVENSVLAGARRATDPRGFAELLGLRAACRAAGSEAALSILGERLVRLGRSSERMSDQQLLAPVRDRQAWAWTELGTLVDSVVCALEPSVTPRAALFRSCQTSGRIFADQRALSDALSSILKIAASSIPTGTRERHQLVVAVRRDHDCFAIEIRDTGDGMWPAEVAAGSPSADTGGWLSLRACNEVLEAHGGSLHLQAELGRGTCCSIRLPAASPPLLLLE